MLSPMLETAATRPPQHEVCVDRRGSRGLHWSSQCGTFASSCRGMWQRMAWPGPACCRGGETLSQIGPTRRVQRLANLHPSVVGADHAACVEAAQPRRLPISGTEDSSSSV